MDRPFSNRLQICLRMPRLEYYYRQFIVANRLSVYEIADMPYLSRFNWQQYGGGCKKCSGSLHRMDLPFRI